MVHELKSWPPVFQHVVDGIKTFEYRRCDDRHFAVGDVLCLREWLPSRSLFSGRMVEVDVVYCVAGGQFGIPDGYCILGVRLVSSRVDRANSQQLPHTGIINGVPSRTVGMDNAGNAA